MLSYSGPVTSVDSAVDRACCALDDGAEVETVEVVVESVSSVTAGFAASALSGLEASADLAVLSVAVAVVG